MEQFVPFGADVTTPILPTERRGRSGTFRTPAQPVLRAATLDSDPQAHMTVLAKEIEATYE